MNIYIRLTIFALFSLLLMTLCFMVPFFAFKLLVPTGKVYVSETVYWGIEAAMFSGGILYSDINRLLKTNFGENHDSK